MAVLPNTSDPFETCGVRVTSHLAVRPVPACGRLDGRFLTANVWGQEVAARGAWEDDDTFLVESQMIGEVDRVTFRFDFTEGPVSLEVRNMTDGSTVRLQAVQGD